MSRTPFRFQRFAINDDQCGMKIGTDGVLLGAWSDVEGTSRILDLGTGCGLIALMLAQRTEKRDVSIDAIDRDKSATIQASQNVANSPWPNRITVKHVSIQDYAAQDLSARYDLCVCNPPFFTNCSPSQDAGKRLARHADHLNRADLFDSVKDILSPSGRFCLVLPFDQLETTLPLATDKGFFLSRETSVRPFPDAEIKRVLLEFVLNEVETSRSEFAIETTRHVFSPTYESLTREFHLRFSETAGSQDP